MWIMTPRGFYSVTTAADGLLQVRARDRKDLLNLHVPEVEILDTPERDYPYRIFIRPETWAAILAEMTTEITYNNFKSKIQDKDASRANLYHRVWADLLAIEDSDPFLRTYRAAAKKKWKGGEWDGPLADLYHDSDGYTDTIPDPEDPEWEYKPIYDENQEIVRWEKVPYTDWNRDIFKPQPGKSSRKKRRRDKRLRRTVQRANRRTTNEETRYLRAEYQMDAFPASVWTEDDPIFSDEVLDRIAD